MNRFRFRIPALFGLGGLGLALIAGCSEQTSQTSAPAASVAPAPTPSTSKPTPGSDSGTAETGEEEHGHKPGAHGGILVSLGRDNYHVEAVFEAGGKLRLYTLGQDESRVVDVERQTLKGFVKTVDGADATPIVLAPEPQDGDAEGRTSQFVAQLPEGLAGQNLTVTVPNIVISGERFRLGFQSLVETHDESMPVKVADEEERQLYLTPGGKYTSADIEANGGVTASAKFKGKMSSHDMQPKTGDQICPITSTKATPKFTWVVDGQKYQFCCPPCLDEFVRMAKTDPDSIKAPGDYVQK